VNERLHAELDDLKQKLTAARNVIGLYAKRSTWHIAQRESGYVAQFPQPWQRAANHLGIGVDGSAPSDLEVLARLSALERELQHGR
jgi:hypothetical protein